MHWHCWIQDAGAKPSGLQAAHPPASAAPQQLTATRQSAPTKPPKQWSGSVAAHPHDRHMCLAGHLAGVSHDAQLRLGLQHTALAQHLEEGTEIQGTCKF